VRVDFYQLTRDPAELVVPLIARATLGAGARLLVLSEAEAQLDRVSAALWQRFADSFLAHGRAGGAHDARQPILLAEAGEGAV
ncbi:DNA polymerase III subunit chi, partial [Enterococcus faecalis]|uniref:DNA polymerase III subunit chi n=1 Tax=Enterococcus faecalis TaxID=1351 RepID=UPI00403F27AB